MGTLTDIRMACHQLAEPEFGHPADLVGWMGAMQAQDYTMSKWAVGLRLKSATIAQVNEALAKGEIVRTHITSYPIAGNRDTGMPQLHFYLFTREAVSSGQHLTDQIITLSILIF